MCFSCICLFVLHVLVFAIILFLLVSVVGCGLRLWHSLDFSINFLSTDLMSLGAHVPGRFEVVRVSCKCFSSHYIYLPSHQNCLATSECATFVFSFSVGVLG